MHFLCWKTLFLVIFSLGQNEHNTEHSKEKELLQQIKRTDMIYLLSCHF